MSAYNPPIYNNAIFNTEDFEEANPTTLTIDYADGHYLKFPYAQGNETFQNKSITFSETATPSSSTISQSTGNLVIAGNEASSNTIVKSKDPSGTDITTFQVNYAYVTVNTTGGIIIENNKSIVLSGKSQNTTYTGWVGNGTNTYSNPSITINDNGKITAISSSSSTSTVASYFGTPSTLSPTLLMTISNYSSWGINDFFTIRISFVQNYGTLNAVGVYPNNASVSGYVNIYPYRLVSGYCSVLSIANSNINNNIQTGASTYDSTFGYYNTSAGTSGYAPYGRATWFYNGQVGTTSNFLVGNTGTAGTFNIQVINANTPSLTAYNLNMLIEVVDKGNAPSGSTITTTGFNKGNISVSY